MMRELVMEALATLDQVAFNRSAWVYRNFREPRISANSSAK
jgi:transcriptional regulator NrdR family protein